MKFTVALLLVLALCHAAPEPKKSKAKASESSNEKRALKDGSYEDTAYFKSVLRSIDPEIDFADDSEGRNYDQHSRSPKISDVLTGEGPHFHATIAGQLYSPGSPYEHKYSEESQSSNGQRESEQETEEEERRPAPKKKAKKQKSKSKHSSHNSHERDNEKDHDEDYDHQEYIYPSYGGLHHNLFGHQQLYPGLGYGLDPRIFYGKHLLNPYLYPNAFGRPFIRPVLGAIPPHPLTSPHLSQLALRNPLHPLAHSQFLLNQGLTHPLQYVEQQGYEQGIPGVSYAQNAQEVNAQGAAANAQQQLEQQQIAAGQQQIALNQQQIGLAQQQAQVQVPQQNYNAQATQPGAVSYATYTQNVPSPFIQVYGTPQEPQPQLELQAIPNVQLQELPSLRPLPNFQNQIIQSEVRPIRLTQGLPAQQQSLPLVRIPQEPRNEQRQQLFSAQSTSPSLLSDVNLEAQSSSPAPTIQTSQSSQSVTIEPLEQESQSTPAPQVTEQTPRPEPSSTPAPESEGNFINVPDQSEAFNPELIIQQPGLTAPSVQYFGNYAESLFNP
ncbi:mediator of RNA polymerase II transcription subunit 15 [Bombyx mori]|uniref:Cuticle protein n=1 Tax=Bombyx mori TaxID=7091 RepID=A0A8R1WGL9_BOMMO|nr:mediator of RNA polymerase II transcription subunit 15 [Bombyx mori]